MQDNDLEWIIPITKKKKKKHKKGSLGTIQALSSSELYQKSVSVDSHSRESSSSRDSQASNKYISGAGVLFDSTPGAKSGKHKPPSDKSEKPKEKKKGYKGRRSLDLNLQSSESNMNGGIAKSASNGVTHRHSVGRTDFINGHGRSQSNGSPGYLYNDGSWKNIYPWSKK